ncbi:hypothetical protein FRB98_007722 [Tulasnella sp. 332]|nr:hypothetical protein FRB98_007722 [Tulasnella sp. 332]
MQSSSDWERITASPLKAASTLSDAFTGTVVAVERGLVETDFKIGDAVAGITRGGWVDTLEENNQGYLNVPPASIWHISDASVKELEAVVPGTNDGCTIV